MRKITIFIVSLVVAMQPGVAQIDTSKLTCDTLPNGLQFVIYADSLLDKASVNLTFHAGSRYDEADQAGVAYLAYRVMQSELATPQHIRSDASTLNYLTGGSIRSAVNYDVSYFTQLLMPEELRLALAMEARRLSPSNYAKDKVNYLRSAIAQQEKIEAVGGAKDLYAQFIRENLFLSPYNLPIRGFADLLEGLTYEEIREFIKDHYAANRAVLTVVSPMAADSVRSLIRGLFRGWPRSVKSIQEVADPIVLPDSLRVDTFYAEGLNLPVTSVMYPLPEIEDTTFFETIAVAGLFFNGPGALFSRSLQEMGVSFAEVGYEQSINTAGGFVGYTLIPGVGQSVDSLKNKLDSLLVYYGENEIPEPAFQEWKRELEWNRLSEFGRAESISRELLFAKAANLDPVRVTQLKEKLIAITREEVRKLVKDHFNPERKKFFIALESDK